jgi:ATP-dependent Clp protease, protease subunit
MAGTFYCGFTGPIDSSSATRLAAAMNHANNEGFDRVHLLFNSLGGYTADGIFLYNHFRSMPIPITIHAIGNVASIALAVYVGGERRLCSKHAIFMTHPTSVPSSAEGMAWERLKASMEAAFAEDNRTEDILRERSSLDESTLAQRRFRDVHFSAEDAVKFGIAHETQEFSLPSGANIIQI